MNVVLVDGTYELFRHFYALPPEPDDSGHDRTAVRGVLRMVTRLFERGATHVGVATDHVIESFRNGMWPGYKTGEGIDPRLRAQFGPLEEALEALGVKVWPMVEFEADDALASAARKAAEDPRVEQVFIMTPDKDLAQAVVGDRVVQADSRTGALRNEAGVVAKFGVPPSSIPDYLALVGDASDGYPGLPGWGPRFGVHGAGALRASGACARRRCGVAPRRAAGGAAGRHADEAARARTPLPRSRHPQNERARVRDGGRAQNLVIWTSGHLDIWTLIDNLDNQMSRWSK